MALENNSQFNTAVTLVTTALQSGSIKLLGPQHDVNAVQNGRLDAAYLTELLENLAAKLPTP